MTQVLQGACPWPFDAANPEKRGVEQVNLADAAQVEQHRGVTYDGTFSH